MKEPAWLPAARALSYGTKRKIQCTGCGTDGTLMISHGSKGFNAYCFRGSCDVNQFHAHGMLSLAQLAERRLATEVLRKSLDFSLPRDFTESLSAHSRLWLLRSGVSDYLRSAYKIGYSPSLDRVILPLYSGGFLARSVDGTTPKYVLKADYKRTLLFTSKQETLLKDAVTEIDAVIVEDVLSAIRVGRVANSQAILGTAFGDGISAAVMAATGKQNPVICVWTDGDKAGRNSRLRIRSGLSLQGCRVTSVVTNKDPKFHSNREIRDCLRASLSQL